MLKFIITVVMFAEMSFTAGLKPYYVVAIVIAQNPMTSNPISDTTLIDSTVFTYERGYADGQKAGKEGPASDACMKLNILFSLLGGCAGATIVSNTYSDFNGDNYYTEVALGAAAGGIIAGTPVVIAGALIKDKPKILPIATEDSLYQKGFADGFQKSRQEKRMGTAIKSCLGTTAWLTALILVVAAAFKDVEP